jgi:hypothetical protein
MRGRGRGRTAAGGRGRGVQKEVAQGDTAAAGSSILIEDSQSGQSVAHTVHIANELV